MDVKERIRLCRLLEQMDTHKEYSRKLGLLDRSRFKDEEERRERHV